jgi:cell division septation protein DedD
MTSTGTEIDDMSEDETYDATEPEESKWGALRTIGALAVLAAFGGFIYLAYMQGVRNGAVGAPPVVAANKSPYKVPPKEPGGTTFANQDKTIYDRVESPAASKSQARVTADTAPAKRASADDYVNPNTAPLVVANTGKSATAPSAGQSTDDGISAAIAAADGGSKSAKAAPTTPKARASSGTTGSIATSGAYLVQIASYRDMDSAHAAWKKLNAKNGDLVSSLAPDYQTADIAGRGTYYRLRIGPFETRDAANSLCSKLKARRQDCLVVKGG